MNDEVWEDIVGYEGLYYVSNKGNVKNNNQYMKQSLTGGYKKLTLTFNKVERTHLVHRLVAEAFIPNPNGVDEVNHKDENKQNNRVENLEWCISKYNANYGTRNERMISKQEKSVCMFNLQGVLIRTFKSCSDVNNYGFLQESVSKCCNGKLKTHKGFIWKYAERKEV